MASAYPHLILVKGL